MDEHLRDQRANQSQENPSGTEPSQDASDLLNLLRVDITARCILLSDTVGNIMLRVGNTDGLALDAITSLLSGGIATLLEAGKNVDYQDVINLAYREGKQSDLYAINVKSAWILIIVMDRGQFYQRLGTVWFYARKAALHLGEILEKIPPPKLPESFNGSLDKAMNDELDKLFQ